LFKLKKRSFIIKNLLNLVCRSNLLLGSRRIA